MTDNTIRQTIRSLLGKQGPRKALFVQLAGDDIGKVYELGQEPVSLGRGPECTVYIDDEQVSREHARIIPDDMGFRIMDLKSTNGTLVNGVGIESHILQDGDRVQVGSFTVFKFNYQDELESTFNEELYNSANRDYLTQVYNKKYLIDRLKMEFSFARRHQSTLAVIMFDIDHFKKINDDHGHLVGDEILKGVCRRINEGKREEDVFARFGGEEFVLMLRAADQKTAYLMAEKMRHLICDEPFKIKDKTLTVTISLGVANLDDSIRNVDELLIHADNQLYEAKRGGRNQTCQRKTESHER